MFWEYSGSIKTVLRKLFDFYKKICYNIYTRLKMEKLDKRIFKKTGEEL